MRATDSGGRGAAGRARRFVVAHRDALVGCYGDAFARFAVFGLQLELGLTLDGSKVAAATLTEGHLIDAAGDRCLVDALVGKEGYGDGSRVGQASVRVLFFFEEAKFINPATGESYGGGGPSRPDEPDRVEMQKYAPMPR